jgi:DNA polymerase-3 subunit gamma/tau
MYQALYRKYRPIDFSDVVGQDIIVKTLLNSLKLGNINHAYLFTGPRGTGKTSIAKILAKSVNCENLVDGVACNKCVNCTQNINKNHVDVIEIDAASNNGVDEIRELRNKVNLVPSLGKYKIYIIDEVHMLTTGAFNALLKTLEEPPKHAIFILATTEPQKIPLTILSRCQRFDFKKISNNYIFKRLKDICNKESIKITDDSIREIARLADGGMRDSLSILDQVSSFTQNEITVEDVHLINGTLTQEELSKFAIEILNKNVYEVLTKIDNFDETGKNFTKILEELILFFKNVLIVEEAPQYLIDSNYDTEVYKNMSGILSKLELIDLIDTMNQNLSVIKKGTVQRLQFELLILKLLNYEKTQNKQYVSNSIKENLSVRPIENKNESKTVIKKENDSYKVDNSFTPINQEIKEKLKKIKEIRINNTLAKFNKKELTKIKSLEDDLKPLLINLDYSKYVSIILDGNLKAASENYLIYVFNTETDSDLFNENILKIEEIVAKVFKRNYKVISTDNISWEIIKKEFNSHLKQYTYVEETESIDQILKNENENKNEIENLFSDAINYN